tara:strand:+ start:19029 stop:19202 length:174 start_codon:yes stop_codon:yes gene_type:complete
MEKINKMPVEQLRESLLNIAWDCQSEWLDGNGVDSWSEDKVRMCAISIVKSLTEIED